MAVTRSSSGKAVWRSLPKKLSRKDNPTPRRKRQRRKVRDDTSEDVESDGDRQNLDWYGTLKTVGSMKGTQPSISPVN